MLPPANFSILTLQISSATVKNRYQNCNRMRRKLSLQDSSGRIDNGDPDDIRWGNSAKLQLTGWILPTGWNFVISGLISYSRKYIGWFVSHFAFQGLISNRLNASSFIRPYRKRLFLRIARQSTPTMLKDDTLYLVIIKLPFYVCFSVERPVSKGQLLCTKIVPIDLSMENCDVCQWTFDERRSISRARTRNREILSVARVLCN